MDFGGIYGNDAHVCPISLLVTILFPSFFFERFHVPGQKMRFSIPRRTLIASWVKDKGHLQYERYIGNDKSKPAPIYCQYDSYTRYLENKFAKFNFKILQICKSRFDHFGWF